MVPQTFTDKVGKEFVVNVEAVPPASADHSLAKRLVSSLRGQPIDAINIAENPMARARMAPLAFASLMRVRYASPFEVVPHLTTRDHNRIGAQGILWGMEAMGVRSVLIVTGDPILPVGMRQEDTAGEGNVVNVMTLVHMAYETGLTPGVVMDTRTASLARERHRLEQKLKAGAKFVITQPLFDESVADALAKTTGDLNVPILLGVLPLMTARHARFLNDRVPQISVPAQLVADLERAGDRARSVGLLNARHMVQAARERFAGVCLMPPFERFEIVSEILSPQSA